MTVDIQNSYLKFVAEKQKIPTYTDMLKAGVSRNDIRYHYGNIGNLHHEMMKQFGEDISKYIAHESYIFSKKKLAELNEDIRTYKRFFITTVVAEKQVFVDFYDSIKNYCERMSAKLILVPCADVFSRSSTSGGWTFDKLLSGESFIKEDTKLNNSVWISSIKTSAKQIKPTTGLGRIGQRNGSYIFASPKQFLEFVVNSPDPSVPPSAMMTTGAITKAEYNNDLYMSERTSYIAENDHVFGGIIVEIYNDKEFHFRQVQADPNNGSFTDLGIVYHSNGDIKKSSAILIPGDYHAGWTDETVKSCIKNICSDIDVDQVFLHDLFDGTSINPHEERHSIVRTQKSIDGKLSLEAELKLVASELEWMCNIQDGDVYVVPSNHNDFLERYLNKGEYVQHPHNHLLCLDLAKTAIFNENPLRVGVEKYLEQKYIDRIVWLNRDDEVNIAGIELGQHGDIGLNGSKGSLMNLEKAFGNCVVGHNHSAAILRGVFRVGVSTTLKMGYNKGPSSWTQTACLVYYNGQRQLINFINGRYTI